MDWGGAGGAAFRLHSNFLKHGHESIFYSQQVKKHKNEVIKFNFNDNNLFYLDIIKRIQKKLLSNQKYFYSFQLDNDDFDIEAFKSSLMFVPDFIIVHFFSEMVTPHSLLRIHQLTGAPIIWNLMDMAVFTGGCHYAWDCEKYTTNCGNCPALKFNWENDYSRKTWLNKQINFQEMKSAVASGSSWLLRQSRQSSLLGRLINKFIPIAVDPLFFSPTRRNSARSHFEIPEGMKVVLWGMANFYEHRKGGFFALDALKQLTKKYNFDPKSTLVLTIGDPRIEIAMKATQFKNIHMGYVNNESMLADLYACADVFLCPSIEDSGPMMINESLMSGTPVVAFRMGVAPDLVVKDETGYIAGLGNVDDLAEGLFELLMLDSDASGRMRNNCRERAETLFHPDRQMAEFISLFHEISHSIPDMNSIH